MLFKTFRLLLGLAFVAGYVAAANNSTQSSSSGQIDDPASLVNLFIGTTNGGNVFPGERSDSSILVHIEQRTDWAIQVRLYLMEW